MVTVNWCLQDLVVSLTRNQPLDLTTSWLLPSLSLLLVTAKPIIMLCHLLISLLHPGREPCMVVWVYFFHVSSTWH